MLCRDRVKIGRAIDVQRRLSGIQTSNPDLVTIAFFEKVPKHLAPEAELRAHATLVGSRIRGEWFGVTPEVAHSAVLMAIQDVTGRGGVLAEALADLAGLENSRVKNETEEMLEDYPEEVAELMGYSSRNVWRR